MTFRKIALGLTLLAALSAHAQTQSPINNGPGKLEQQVIGDTVNTADRTNSTTNQIGNSAASNGNDLSTATDIRTQISPTNTNTSSTSSNALGANLALGNNSDAHASNGPQTMGQANTGTVGNTTATTGPSTSSVGNTTAAGGAGGQGGQGGAATSNGTNLGINGQQQGIDRSGNSANNVQGGDQRNAQGQQQAATANGTNTARNTQNTSAGNGAGAGAGSNNRTVTSVDAADRSSTSYTDNSRAVAWAPVIHGPAAPALAAANMVVVPGKCGPRMMVVSRDVIGQRFKSLLPDSTFVQTQTDRLVPLTDGNGLPMAPFEERGGYLVGHEVITFAVTAGTSTAGSISIGLFGKGGDAGQGGSASSGAVQQVIKEIELRDCIYTHALPPMPPADRSHGPAVSFIPQPTLFCEPAPVARKRVAVRKPAPKCLAVAG